jgi:hypothetical protein
MNADTFIKAELAALAVREGAHHGGLNNMVAVAMVMRNRAAAGWYGGEWAQILDRAPDRAGTLYPHYPVNLRDGSVRQLLQRIDDIYDGSEEFDLSAGALFYCELHRVDGKWFQQNILKNREEHKMVATVGPVSFFE